MESEENPTVEDGLTRFGGELRRLRKAAGFTQAELGRALDLKSAAIGHYEAGRRKPDAVTISRLDEVLGDTRALTKLAPQMQGAQAASYAVGYHELVRSVRLAREYHPTLIPGLLQTGRYAECGVRAGDPVASDNRVQEIVDVRMGVQEQVLNQKDPKLWVIIQESSLTVLKDEDLLQEQIAKLQDLVSADRIRLQVIPNTVPFKDHPGLDGAFSLLTRADGTDVGYAEGVVSGTIVTKGSVLERLKLKFAALQSVAMSPAESTKLIEKIGRV